jgi:hypothetical protein
MAAPAGREPKVGMFGQAVDDWNLIQAQAFQMARVCGFDLNAGEGGEGGDGLGDIAVDGGRNGFAHMGLTIVPAAKAAGDHDAAARFRLQGERARELAGSPGTAADA